MEDEVFLEISANGNFIKITPLTPCHLGAELDWDKNWIKTQVEIKGGCFKGSYIAEFQTHDFTHFSKALSILYNNLNGSAHFNDLEGYLTLNIQGDGIGHFEINCIADSQPGVNSTKLDFDLFFDQTQIPQMIKQLDVINNKFPVIGDFRNRR